MRSPTASLFAAAAVLVGTGCTSYVDDFSQPMKIETRSADGSVIAGARCTLRNDKASLNVTSGDTVGVRRSREPLQIECSHPGQPPARAQVLSRINTAMIGNVLFGSGTAGLIGRSGGTAYTYPAWIQLVFGQTLEFDRGDEKDVNQPTPARAPSAAR
jgi:hypothetical protein